MESEEPEAKLQSVAKAEAKANQSAKIRVRLGTMARKRNTHHPNVDKKVCVGGMEGKELRQPGEVLHSPWMERALGFGERIKPSPLRRSTGLNGRKEKGVLKG